MTQFLPPSLLALFAARDPIPYLPPVTKLTHEKATTGYSGVGDYLKFFEDPADTPPPTKYETRDERQSRKRREKQEQVVYKLEQEIAVWNPNENEKSTSDAFRTLFVGRINYDSSDSKLKREFESYGPVKKIVLQTNKKSGKPRGYAFVEFEHERDMHSAYRHADGKKIDGKRVLVDIERGRTVKGWLPRRLGGGLGGTRRGGPEVNLKISGREDPDRDRFRDDARDDARPNRRADRSKDRERNDSVKRDRSRERDRGRDKDRDKDRNRDRVERNPDRDRDRDRDRERGENRVERKRRRSRSKDKKDKDIEEGGEDKPRKRSRSRDKKKHRSKSRDRKRGKREKDRDGERGDRDRGDRDRDRKGKDRIKAEDPEMGEIRVKQEPLDDYPNYDDSYYNGGGYMKPEPDDEAEEGGPAVLRSDGAGNEDYGEY